MTFKRPLNFTPLNPQGGPTSTGRLQLSPELRKALQDRQTQAVGQGQIQDAGQQIDSFIQAVKQTEAHES